MTMSRRDVAGRLEALAKRQHGHVTRAQALAAGMTPGQLRGRLERRDWSVWYPSVYRMFGVPHTWEADVAASLLAAGNDAVVSHSSAARLHGLDRARPAARIELTVPYGRRTKPQRSVRGVGRGPSILVHRSRSLEAIDVGRAERFTVTTPARTLIDLSSRHRGTQIVALVDDVIGARIVSRSRLNRRAEALRRGRSAVQAIIDVTQPGAEGIFRSWLERETSLLFARYAIEGAEWNVQVSDGPSVAVVDVLFRDEWLPLEIEGPRFHEPPRLRRSDAARSNLLHRLRLYPLRYTWYDIVEEPERVAKEIREALAVRRTAA